ncbi:MAG: MetS family NSS transporter small subunit [Ignavibacteriales bacterium]|nr:MAG: MetS family NSS transporter small subunit [Ignavibacteriales bacterium]
MTTSAIFTMIIVLGVVWGGVAYFIFRAFKYEKEKLKIGED